MIEHKIHPTPVFEESYDITSDINEAEAFIKNLEKTSQGLAYYSETGYTSYGIDNNVLCSIPNLKKFIDDKVYEVHCTTGIAGKTEYAMSWASINRKYSVHGKHNHLPFTWSGVLYIKAKTGDADIQFFNANLNSAWPYAPFGEKNYFSPIKISPSTGKLLVFPSYLDHEVLEQKINNERITISFNYNLTP